MRVSITSRHWPRNGHIEKYLHTWVDYQSVAWWKIVFPLRAQCMLPPYWKHLISALDFLPRREEEGGSSWGKNWYVFAARQHFYGLSLKELNFRQEAVIKSSLTQSKVLAIGKRKQNLLDYVVSHIIRFSGNWILFFVWSLWQDL